MSTYGFYIKNGNGAVVLTDEYIIYQLFEETTLTGIYNPTFDCYTYQGDSSSIQFFRIDVWDWLGRTHNNVIISNKSSIVTRKLKTSNSITVSGTEYGLNLYNAQGVLTYSSNSPVGGIKEFIDSNSVIFSTPLFTTSPNTTHPDKDYSWFCITTTWIVSGIFNTVSGTGCPVVGKTYSGLSLGHVRFYTSEHLSINGSNLIVDSNCRLTVLCA